MFEMFPDSIIHLTIETFFWVKIDTTFTYYLHGLQNIRLFSLYTIHATKDYPHLLGNNETLFHNSRVRKIRKLFFFNENYPLVAAKNNKSHRDGAENNDQ